MPDVVSIGLGGGSIVRVADDGSVTVGPDSVGYAITERALGFGGDTMTATDIAGRLGMAAGGDASLVADIPQDVAERAMAVMRAMVEDAIDVMKVSSDPIDVVLVGGGAIVLPHELAGTAEVDAPEHAGCANAIGSAISKVSGVYEALVDYDVTPRDEALAAARAAAVEAAVEAGAVRDTVEIIDAEDVPLAYYPGHTNRVKPRATGRSFWVARIAPCRARPSTRRPRFSFAHAAEACVKGTGDLTRLAVGRSGLFGFARGVCLW